MVRQLLQGPVVRAMEGISVIISYHNESATLEKTLDLLAAQTFLPKEILLVNSNSTDDSSLVIQKWIDRNRAMYKPIVRNIDEGTNVPGSSMNVGIRNASFNLLAFMDCNLYFDCNWLARQMTYMKTNESDVVSGICHFSGTSLQDKSAIAQTYGYHKSRPTVPSSLVRKDVFEKTGLFLENKRAGHDVDWIRKLKRDNILRDINKDVVIKYMGTNYAKSMKDIFLKTIRYSESTVDLYGYYNHHIYGVFLLVIAAIYFIKVGFLRPWPYNEYIPLVHIDKLLQYINIRTGLIVCLIYIILRGYIIPLLKSQNLRLLYEHPLSLLTLPVVGFLMDIGKLIGYIKGTFNSFLAKLKKRINNVNGKKVGVGDN